MTVNVIYLNESDKPDSGDNKSNMSIANIKCSTTEELIQRKFYIIEAMDAVSSNIAGQLAGLYEEILAELSVRGISQKSSLAA